MSDWDDDEPYEAPTSNTTSGGGGRGAGGGGTCYRCNEEGHMARDCPTAASGGGGGGGRACYKCNEEGHMARDCPTAGSGGGGGGGGRACYKCNEEGHMARDCPTAASGGGGGGGRACYKCNEEGHMARDCPNPDAENSGNRSSGCRKCGEDGHFARDCPTGGSGGGGGGGRACYKCNEEGHMARDCPNADAENPGNRSSGCRKCGEDGHFARDCPTGGSGGGGGGGRACYKCNEEGHMARDCPNADAENSGNRSSGCRKCGEDGHFARDCPTGGDDAGGHRSRGCYNCGEDGHMSKDCTNERKEDVDRPPRRPREGEEGADVKLENYIPPEMLEGDAMFDDRKKDFEGTGINFSKYQSIPYSITGENLAKSVETFEQLELRPLILENLKKCGYDTPTPIQRHGSPQLMAGRHVMCCAQTGSGKTAAFLLPIINRLLQQADTLSCAGNSPIKPEALILAPTRELAIQIAKESTMYANGSIIKTQVIYGGTATLALKNKLSRGCNILVATTGRLKQFVKESVVDLSNVTYFILDEADRMLDMGFMPDVEEIVEKLPPKEKRVSGLFSATFASEIQQAAAKFLHDHVYIVIGVVGGACTDVIQEIVEVEKTEKRKKILDILNEETNKGKKALVFCASKKGADFLATHLVSNNVSCTSIHGDRLQSQREQALREFTTGVRQVLVATSVAARGLDIPKVALVINYDLPHDIDEYVHRIGRTGRVGHTGRAISFYDAAFDAALLNNLMSILEGAGQKVPSFLQGQENGHGGGMTEGDFASTDVRGSTPKAAAAAGGDDEDDWD